MTLKDSPFPCVPSPAPLPSPDLVQPPCHLVLHPHLQYFAPTDPSASKPLPSVTCLAGFLTFWSVQSASPAHPPPFHSIAPTLWCSVNPTSLLGLLSASLSGSSNGAGIFDCSLLYLQHLEMGLAYSKHVITTERVDLFYLAVIK